MKKLLAAAALIGVFLAFQPVTHADATPQPPGCGELCADLVPPFSSFGACMGACNVCLNPSTSGGKTAACFCKQLGDIIGFPAGPWKNQGACVSDLNGSP